MADIDIRPVLSKNILMLKENRSLESEITVNYNLEGEKMTQRIPYKVMAIFVGRHYTEAEVKRLNSAMKTLDERIAREKLEREFVKKIKDRLDIEESVFKKLRLKGLSYSEIIITIYISKGEIDDVLSLRADGKSWHDIISLFDLGVSDVASLISETEKSLYRPKPKPKEREVEKGFYQR